MSNFLDFDETENDVPVVMNDKPKDRDGSSVRHFIDTEYKDFSMYVLQHRAIPSVIDGFKTSQRKLFYAMQTYGGKRVKVAELGGSLSSIGYGHGETSANDAAVRMARAWANNIPAFIGHGNFGSRMLQEAAAPRYIYATMNPKAEAIFIDNDVLIANEDLEHKEPKHFLPAIPWLLVNGASGIAVGFKAEILPRNPKDVVKACEEYITTGSIKTELMPFFPAFKGKVEKVEDRKFVSYGVVEKGPRNSYIVTELPWIFDRQKYFDILVDMVETGKISEFEDHCDKTGFKFIIKMNPDQRNSAEKDIYKYLKLYETYTEIFTTLDENGNIKIFDSVNDIIAHFCDYRVKKKAEQRAFDAKQIENQIDFLTCKLKFIEAVISKGTDTIVKMKKLDLENWITELNGNDRYTATLSKLPIYSFTEDEIERLKESCIQKKTELEEHNKIKPEDALLKNMKESIKK